MYIYIYIYIKAGIKASCFHGLTTGSAWWQTERLFTVASEWVVNVMPRKSGNKYQNNTIKVKFNKHTCSPQMRLNASSLQTPEPGNALQAPEAMRWGLNAKEPKHMLVISNISDNDRGMARLPRVRHVVRLCLCSGLPSILYIRPFVLSVTSIYLNWSMLQCATMPRPGPCCCSLM